MYVCNMNLDFILVSQSPRRKELLQQAGYHFLTQSVNTDETLNPDLSPEENAQNIAKNKVLAYLTQTNQNNIPLIGADTIVVTQENEILGKPKNSSEALSFLQKLQGRSHKVITGVCIHNKLKKISLTFFNQTVVHISELTEEEMKYYIENFQPFDKAGAYGVQDWFGLRFIHKIEGCYYNVVGFPVPMFSQIMKKLKQNTQL